MEMPLFFFYIVFESFSFTFSLLCFDYLLLRREEHLDQIQSSTIGTTSINRICLSCSLSFVSKLVEIEITEGCSVPWNDLDFRSSTGIGSAAELKVLLFSAASKPPRDGDVRCWETSKSSCCRWSERTRREESTNPLLVMYRPCFLKEKEIPLDIDVVVFAYRRKSA